MEMAVLAGLVDEVPRLKREDQSWTEHDSKFSEWKVLIGPQDWEDYSAGKGGVSKYRVKNLPRCSRSGLYELAIYRSLSLTRDNHGEVDPDKVVVVYLGEADDVRTRLQQYGRTGSHLCGTDFGENICPRFDEIFERGCSIVYRWIPMENKARARRKEAEILSSYDYAWNKGCNGARRHDDILRKLDKHALNPIKQSNLSIRHLPFLRMQLGIEIKASKLTFQGNDFSKYAYGEMYKSLGQVFKFSRSLPRLVLDHGGYDENITCGVILEDGSICGRPPIEGRKRCAEHKGRKGSAVRLSSSEKSQPHKARLEYVLDNGESNVRGAKIPSLRLVPALAGDLPKIEQSSPICGVAMDDGSLCRRQPVSGRTRCDLHKGRRICSSNSGTTRYQIVPNVVFDSYADEASRFDKKSSEIRSPGKLKVGVSPQRPVFSEGLDTICGVEFGNGNFCTKQPARGRIRCEDHKGMQVTSLLSRLDAKSTSNVFGTDSRFDSRNRNYGSNTRTSICGAPNCNGSPCQRIVEGNGRCFQHSNYDGSSSSRRSNFSSKYLDYGGGNSSTCGAPTINGAPCQRTVEGNGRCFQHSKNGGSSTTSCRSNFSSQYSDYDGRSSSICGAPTLNAAPCQRNVEGNGRCFQHSNCGGSSTASCRGNFSSKYSDYGRGSSSICGAPTLNGAPCQRTVEGNGRCFQHSNYGGSSTSSRSYFSSRYSDYGGGGSSICGAPTRNGSFCRRTVRGNGRCWQH